MKKKSKLSIKATIIISMAVLTLFMLVILWTLQFTFFDTFYKTTKENDVKRASNLIVDNVGSDNLDELVGQVAIEYQLCIKVVQYSGFEMLYSPECQKNDCLLHKLNDDANLYSHWFNSANQNNGEYTEVVPKSQFDEYNSEEFKGEAPQGNGNSLISVRLVQDTQGELYLLILNASIEPMSATVGAMRIMLILVSILLILFCTIISLVLSFKLSKPIVEMNENAKKLALANYDVEFLEEGPREIQELAATLNITTRELGKLDAMQKELIANISHDLRTPLTMISGYSEVMRDIPGENTPENMQVIIDEAARLTSLVNDLLNVSKLQAGTQVMNIQRMSLTMAVSKTVERYAKFKEQSDFNIVFNYTHNVYIMADETRLLQVIYNLTNNAINYSGEDKTVTITQTVENDVVRISVTDTGCGIKDEDLPLIWDRYYKVDKVHKRAVIGTGLGLSIVKNILLLHGSRFGVSSEIDKGSTFWFEFKIAE